MPHTDRSPGKNPGCVISPVGSAVPTPDCKLSDSSDDTACHKLWLWHPARHLLPLGGSATGAAFPPEHPKPATEGSSLQMPTDPGGTAHPLYNRGQALSTSSLVTQRAAHLPYIHGIQRYLCRHRDLGTERTRPGLGMTLARLRLSESSQLQTQSLFCRLYQSLNPHQVLSARPPNAH